MKLYIVNINSINNCLSVGDFMIADRIALTNDLIRGYTTNYFILIRYLEFLEQIIGKYIKIDVYDFDIRDDSTKGEIEVMAHHLLTEYINKQSVYGGSTCPEITVYEIDNGKDFLYTTESMVSYFIEIDNDDYALQKLFFLFDKNLNYLLSLQNNNSFIKMVKYLKNNFGDVKDIFYRDNECYIDLYSILKRYIKDLKFID